MAVGLAISAVGAAGQMANTKKAAKASKQAERLRKEQMRLDAMRRRRETIRQSIVANSLARARSVSQGAGLDSSALFGAYAQTSGEVGRQINYTNQSERIGAGIFDANAAIATAQGNAAMFNQFGQFGNALMGNAATISKIGTSLLTGTSGTTVNPFTTTTTFSNPAPGSVGYPGGMYP